MNSDLTSRKMAEMPVTKLMFNMSLPAIISMLVQALYNVVDSLFLARYTTPLLTEQGYTSAALDAVSIAFPMQMMVGAFAIGIGVGTNAYISRMLGAKRGEDASRSAQHGLFLALVCAAVFVVLGFTVARPFVSLYTDDAVIGEMSATYLNIVMSVGCFAFVEITLNKMLQATGNMVVPMLSQLAGAVTNMILDPLMIFGIGFFPEMGVAGAAAATVIGQGCAMLVTVGAFVFKRQDISLNFRGFKFKKEYFAGIMKIGLPSTVMNAVNSVTTSLMNIIIKPFAYAITVLGLYFKVQSFVFMPVFGLMQGALPILSYNYGANQPQRFKQAFKVMLITSFGILFAGLLLFELAPAMLMSLFDASEEMSAVGVVAFRRLALCFLPAAFGISFTTTIQALNKGKTSLLMSLMRQVLLILPLAFILAKLFGANGVWFSYPLAEVICLAVFAPVTIKGYKEKFSQLQTEGNIS